MTKNLYEFFNSTRDISLSGVSQASPGVTTMLSGSNGLAIDFEILSVERKNFGLVVSSTFPLPEGGFQLWYILSPAFSSLKSHA